MLPMEPKQRAQVVAAMYGGTTYVHPHSGMHGVRLSNGATMIPSLMTEAEIEAFAERQHRQKKRYSKWQQAVLSVTGAYYGLADSVVGGALPDKVAGVQIVPTGSAGSNPGGSNNIPQDLGGAASDTVYNTVSRLPDVGALVGDAVKEAMEGVGGGTRALFLPVAVAGAVGVGLLLAAGYARGRR